MIAWTLIEEDFRDLDLLQILLQFGRNYVKINEIPELYMRLIMQDADLQGKCAIITGAGRGIGLCIASRFLQGGGNVVIAEADATARMLF
jgi:short-subunit dehydrogenase involved in D-alanine esterification of teichoic acids